MCSEAYRLQHKGNNPYSSGSQEDIGGGSEHVSTFLLLQASCLSHMPHMLHRNQSSVLEAGDVVRNPAEDATNFPDPPHFAMDPAVESQWHLLYTLEGDRDQQPQRHGIEQQNQTVYNSLPTVSLGFVYGFGVSRHHCTLGWPKRNKAYPVRVGLQSKRETASPPSTGFQ